MHPFELFYLHFNICFKQTLLNKLGIFIWDTTINFYNYKNLRILVLLYAVNMRNC